MHRHPLASFLLGATTGLVLLGLGLGALRLLSSEDETSPTTPTRRPGRSSSSVSGDWRTQPVSGTGTLPARSSSSSVTSIPAA
jgi:hypothetical protein